MKFSVCECDYGIQIDGYKDKFYGYKEKKIILYPEGLYYYNVLFYLFQDWAINCKIHYVAMELYKKTYGL